MMNRVFEAAPLNGTQYLDVFGKEISAEQIVTLAAPGTVEVHFRRGVSSIAGMRLTLEDLDTVIATLRTARKIVKHIGK